jgi:hypothetical protein
MARGDDEMRQRSEASDEIWKSGYNWKPTKERSDETRSGEIRGIAVGGELLKVAWENLNVWRKFCLVRPCPPQTSRGFEPESLYGKPAIKGQSAGKACG